ncbi:MAG: hypothetical protein IIV57_05675, partial [Bacteroidaceae bacterium]|nr:hypothetical protein [Bacteroidaceae bacterium]
IIKKQKLSTRRAAIVARERMKCAPRGMRKATLANNKKAKIIDKTSSNSRARADEMRTARDAKSDSCQ